MRVLYLYNTPSILSLTEKGYCNTVTVQAIQNLLCQHICRWAPNYFLFSVTSLCVIDKLIGNEMVFFNNIQPLHYYNALLIKEKVLTNYTVLSGMYQPVNVICSLIIIKLHYYECHFKLYNVPVFTSNCSVCIRHAVYARTHSYC